METTSVLTKKQTKTFGPREYTENGQRYKITAKVRYDDDCGNGHNTFSITGNIDRCNNYGRWVDDCSGCIHEEIAKHFPELEPYIKWHLVSSDGPMHYIANTVYHVDEHGPTHAWIYYTEGIDPLGIGGNKDRLLSYIKADDAKKADGVDGYTVKWDEKTIKVANLDYARSSAVWPDATDDQLKSGKHALTLMLQDRLPTLMEEFKAAVESLGFVY